MPPFPLSRFGLKLGGRSEFLRVEVFAGLIRIRDHVGQVQQQEPSHKTFSNKRGGLGSDARHSFQPQCHVKHEGPGEHEPQKLHDGDADDAGDDDEQIEFG